MLRRLSKIHADQEDLRGRRGSWLFNLLEISPERRVYLTHFSVHTRTLSGDARWEEKNYPTGVKGEGGGVAQVQLAVCERTGRGRVGKKEGFVLACPYMMSV